MRTCEFCGAKIVKYTHRLNKDMGKALKNLYRYKLKCVKISEILEHNQICNFQKLKHWELVEKCKLDGFWKLTERGIKFIEGKILIPNRVVTFRDVVIAYYDGMVGIKDLESGYEKKGDYVRNSNRLNELFDGDDDD